MDNRKIKILRELWGEEVVSRDLPSYQQIQLILDMVGISCPQLRPVLIVLELAPLTQRKLKYDNKTHKIQKFMHIISIPCTPPPSGGEGGLSKMAQVPKGEKFSPATSTLGVKNFILY